MDRHVVIQAIEFFLDPSMRRYPGYAKDYWLELRLCLDKKPNQRKRAKILGQIDALDKIKANIGDFAMSSQADSLLAMAYKASHAAKRHWLSFADRPNRGRGASYRKKDNEWLLAVPPSGTAFFNKKTAPAAVTSAG